MLSLRKIRQTVTENDRQTMIRLRRKGFTLAFIGEVMNLSSMTIYNHTKHVPAMTRRKGTMKVDRRTGKLAA